MKAGIKNFCLSLPEKKKPSKFKSKITLVDGMKFHSKAEANYYNYLKYLQNIGAILKFTRQPVFRFKFKHHTGYIYKMKYYADFRVWFSCDQNKKCKWTIIDVKGCKTQEYLLRKRLMLKILNIKIVEIKNFKYLLR